jgi:hypothetical protein
MFATIVKRYAYHSQDDTAGKKSFALFAPSDLGVKEEDKAWTPRQELVGSMMGSIIFRLIYRRASTPQS